mmetsp:Transcript_24776/g.59834  ORF Transcript_24776/g.59834 Transcript_24776/m.59834 type:complete len:237 (+) Transcript_24776:2766-3476(+)
MGASLPSTASKERDAISSATAELHCCSPFGLVGPFIELGWPCWFALTDGTSRTDRPVVPLVRVFNLRTRSNSFDAIISVLAAMRNEFFFLALSVGLGDPKRLPPPLRLPDVVLSTAQELVLGSHAQSIVELAFTPDVELPSSALQLPASPFFMLDFAKAAELATHAKLRKRPEWNISRGISHRLLFSPVVLPSCDIESMDSRKASTSMYREFDLERALGPRVGEWVGALELPFDGS